MIHYTEDWLVLLLFQLKGSSAPRALLFAIPSAMMGVFLVESDTFFGASFQRDIGMLGTKVNASLLWTVSIAILVLLLVFRVNRAMARFWEGTGLLHQMRGEWFDSVSCCITFSRNAKASRKEEVMRFRHTIIRLMSICHGSALKEIGETDEEHETIDPLGLDPTTLHHLRKFKSEGFNRVEILLHLIQCLVIARLDDGILLVPPPILTRVFQTLSRGFVNLLNAKKIADTRFPFPFAQLIAMLLLLNVILTPYVIACLFSNAVLAGVFSFIPIFGCGCLNFIGVELENPFGSDPNDLPLEHFQAEMNNCLLMLLHPNSDILPAVDYDRCQKEVNNIRSSMVRGENISHTMSSALHVCPNSGDILPESDEADQLDVEAAQEEHGLDREMTASMQDVSETSPARNPANSLPEVSSAAEALKPEQLLHYLREATGVLREIQDAVDGQVSTLGRCAEDVAKLTLSLQTLTDPAGSDLELASRLGLAGQHFGFKQSPAPIGGGCEAVSPPGND